MWKLKRKKKGREKSSNKKQKLKTWREKEIFWYFFSLNKIKRNVSNVDYSALAPPRYFFLKISWDVLFFNIFSLEYANFGSILAFGEWWFLSGTDRNFTTFSVGRAHAIQKCADIDFFSGNMIYYNMSTSFRQNAFCFVSLRII